MDDDTIFCSNCKRDIPRANSVMHQVHCQRNIAMCPECDEPIPRSELERHREEEHSLVACPQCKAKVEKRLLEEHKKDDCSLRMVVCRFCQLDLTSKDMPEHENYCGSRTEKCECGEYVMLKYQQLHIDSNHGFLKLDDEPGPARRDLASPPLPLLTAMASSKGQHLPWEQNSILPDPTPDTPPHPGHSPPSFLRKIPNASQDWSRPTSSANRLSPVKRTNDMPQVNQQQQHGMDVAKRLEKTSLRDMREIDQVDQVDQMTMEQLDRILAYHLAKEEAAKKIAAVRRDREKEELRWDRVTNGKATDVGRRESDGENEEDGEVKLPCEFCERLMCPEELVMHQAECMLNPVHGSFFQPLRPSAPPAYHRAPTPPPLSDLTPTPTPTPSPSPPSSPVLNNLSTHSSVHNTVMLPCEFCGTPFLPDSLIAHQVVCDLNEHAVPESALHQAAFGLSGRISSLHPPPPLPLPPVSRSSSDDTDMVNYNLGNREEDKVRKDLGSIAHEKGSSYGQRLRNRNKDRLQLFPDIAVREGRGDHDEPVESRSQYLTEMRAALQNRPRNSPRRHGAGGGVRMGQSSGGTPSESDIPPAGARPKHHHHHRNALGDTRLDASESSPKYPHKSNNDVGDGGSGRELRLPQNRGPPRARVGASPPAGSGSQYRVLDTVNSWTEVNIPPGAVPKHKGHSPKKRKAPLPPVHFK